MTLEDAAPGDVAKLRLSLRDGVLVGAAWASIAAACAVTAFQVTQMRQEISAERVETAALRKELEDHEKLPWHAGYGATLPMITSDLNDITMRLRELERNEPPSRGAP